ncbi:hypothetical protein [Burkholderia ubonensis]|uniref:hypothetical protein n=1 Tax=Burkholderia ubonensis TaxID=101571 RepID=UPI0012FB7BDF|nr:hypothetical protein [Burkholderia ubonensis]
MRNAFVMLRCRPIRPDAENRTVSRFPFRNPPEFPGAISLSGWRAAQSFPDMHAHRLRNMRGIPEVPGRPFLKIALLPFFMLARFARKPRHFRRRLRMSGGVRPDCRRRSRHGVNSACPIRRFMCMFDMKICRIPLLELLTIFSRDL